MHPLDHSSQAQTQSCACPGGTDPLSPEGAPDGASGNQQAWRGRSEFVASIPFVPAVRSARVASLPKPCAMTQMPTAFVTPSFIHSRPPPPPARAQALPAGLHILAHPLPSNLGKETSLQLWVWFLFPKASSPPESSFFNPFCQEALSSLL